MKMIKFLALSLLLSNTVLAADIVIINGKLIEPGTDHAIENSTIVISNGKITAVGRNPSIPQSATVIDAKGKVVTPGLIAVDNTLGITEINARANANDASSKSKSLSAAFDVQYAVNPNSTLLPIARMEGVTSALASPTVSDKDAFAGLAAEITLKTGYDTVEKGRVAEVLDLEKFQTSVGRGAALVMLDELFDQIKKGSSKISGYSLTDVSVIQKVLSQELPLIIRINRASDILNVIAFVKRWNLNAYIQGAAEGWLVADNLAQSKIPVILDTYSSLPTSFDILNTSLENAAKLNKAGVKIVIRGDKDGHFARNLRYYAGMAVAHGLPWNDAITAITKNAAELLGDKDKGTLTPGSIADIVVWSGDPLEPLTRPEVVIIHGEVQTLLSRHTMLRDRYLK